MMLKTDVIDRRAIVIIVILLFLAIAMRLVNLNEGLWLDEIWSMVMSSPDKSVMDIINACKSDTHPPFFDLLLHFYLRLFGNDPINGRILSMLIGFMGIFATFYYSLRISKSYFTAIISLGLISLSFFHIYYSEEGRFYTFLYLLSLSVISNIYFYIKNGKRKYLVPFTLLSIILVYTHYYGVILLLAIALVMLFLWIKKEIDLSTFLYFAFSGLIVLLAFSPWLPYMFSGQEKESWMQSPHIYTFFEYLYNYTGKNPVEFLFLLTALLLSFKFWKKNVALYSLLYGTIILGFLIPYIVSLLSLPMLHMRYTFIYFPSIILMTAIFWEQINYFSLRTKRIIFLLTFISILVNFFFINDYIKGTHKEPWKEIAEDMVNENKVIYTELGFYLDYYLDQYDQPHAKDISMINEEDAFYYLKSPYDESALNTEGYKLIEEKDYGKGFVLYSYQIEE
jgi:uncharacterized membrane protein